MIDVDWMIALVTEGRPSPRVLALIEPILGKDGAQRLLSDLECSPNGRQYLADGDLLVKLARTRKLRSEDSA